MNTADAIQLGVLIVAIYLMYRGIAKDRKTLAEKEAVRDVKFQQMSEDIAVIKSEIKDHSHPVYESNVTEWEARCQLREQITNQAVKELGIRVNEHLNGFIEMKKAVQPIPGMNLQMATMGEQMKGIDSLLREKISNINHNHEELKQRFDKHEETNKRRT